MERYKEELNNIHAPEDLILKTLAKVHEEEKKVEAEKSQQAFSNITNMADEFTATNNSSDTVNNVNYRNSVYYGVDKTEESGELPVKKSFFEMYGKYIKIGSSIAAAAAVLLIAMSLRSLNGSNSATDSAPSYSEATEASTPYKEDEEESADEAYEAMADEAADDSDDFEESETVAGDDSFGTTNSASSSASSRGTASDFYYNSMTSTSDKTKNAVPTQSDTLTVDDSASEAAAESAAESDETYDYSADISVKNLSVEEYSEYVGLDIKTLEQSIPVKESGYMASVDDEGNGLIYDSGKITLDLNEGSADLLISQTRSVGPQSILKGIPSYVGDVQIYMAESEDGKQLYAVFDMNKVHFCLEATDVSKDVFENILKVCLNKESEI